MSNLKLDSTLALAESGLREKVISLSLVSLFPTGVVLEQDFGLAWCIRPGICISERSSTHYFKKRASSQTVTIRQTKKGVSD